MLLIGFIIGMFVGATFGALMMVIVAAGAHADRDGIGFDGSL